jgi:hypothetical protein
MKSADLKKLTQPFPAKDIEWRIQQSGLANNGPWAMVLAYVTNRAIMDRLDEVCGPENWKNDYSTGPNGGLLCHLSIKVNKEWITKVDGAENTQVEAIKGGLSAAMKRAGAQWGIGRYLYNLETNFATFSPNGKYKAKISNQYHKWDAPKLPTWALPEIVLQKPGATPKRVSPKPKTVLKKSQATFNKGVLNG